MKKTIFVALLFALITGCVKDFERIFNIHEWKNYTIEEGKHFNNGIHINTMSTDHLDFRARFDETAMYTASTKANQQDINKLYGFTDCNSEVEGCSARFGWLWNIKRNKLEIYAYTHSSGQIFHKYLGDADFNKEYSCSIYCVGDHYNFNFDGNLVEMPRECGQSMVVRYMCYPYFGGNDAAPHQINIAIRN